MVEKIMTYKQLELADKIFATGNCSKVVPATRIEVTFFLSGLFMPKPAGFTGRSRIRPPRRCSP
jgi:branched-subunit amino acid aminotransferase/4-amino-4-deoxychorismate lyase